MAFIDYLSLDLLERKPDISDRQRGMVKGYNTKFNRADRLVLYPIVVGLTVNALAVIYQISQFQADNIDDQRDALFIGEVFFVLLYSLVTSIVRVAIFKYYLLRPAQSMIAPTDDPPCGAFMFALAALAFVGAVVLTTVSAVLAITDAQGDSVLVAVFGVVCYVAAPLFYRLHVATYIKRASEAGQQGGEV